MRGKLWFVCLASSRTIENVGQDQLQGHLLLFHAQEIWRAQARPLIGAAQSLLRQYRFRQDGGLRPYFEKAFADLAQRLYPLSAFNATFTVDRNGLCEITVPDLITKHPTAPDFGEGEHAEHIKHVLCAQLFFFLRDIGHRHQHHDPNTDTIVDLWADEPHDPFNWKLQTLYSLYRKVITYKRVQDHKRFASSHGVLAYADTFREIVSKDPASKGRLPDFHSHHVAASIASVSSELGRQHDLRLEWQAATRELILSCIALVIALIGVFEITNKKVDAEPSQFLYGVASLLITQPFLSLCVIMGLIYTMRLLMSGGAQNTVTTSLLRVVQPLDLRVAIAVFFLLGGAAFAAIAYVVFGM